MTCTTVLPKGLLIKTEADKGDRGQLERDREIRELHRHCDIADQKRQSVQHAAKCGTAAGDQTAHKRPAATRDPAVVGQRFRQPHADAGAERAGEPDEESAVALWVSCAAAKSGASVYTAPSINPSSAGCTTCNTARE
jgi:hypothetical protein